MISTLGLVSPNLESIFWLIVLLEHGALCFINTKQLALLPMIVLSQMAVYTTLLTMRSISGL